MDLSRYWKTIVDTLQDGVIIVDSGGTILSVNPAAERMTGYKAAELVGKSCRVLDCTGCQIIGQGKGKNWCGLFSREGVTGKHCLMTSRDRHPINIIKNAVVLRDETGAIIGAVETLRDMSDVMRQRQEIMELRKTLHLDEGFHGMLGKSAVMANLFELVENVALTDAPVMITGESGTGKELVARAIHESSPRRDGPFIKVNCAALNENLLESELFGHARGAYTGAVKDRVGRFEAAHGGSIFLDEIGEISLSTQVKLLRTLEEREIERVGDQTTIQVDVRVISATNRDLELAIADGRFREDLYFRINVFPITCPPLRKRAEDIPVLAQRFIRRNNQKSGKKILGVSPEAMEKMMVYPWPGNVRELRNTMEYAFVLCSGGGIGVQHLPPKIAGVSLGCPESLAPVRSEAAPDRSYRRNTAVGEPAATAPKPVAGGAEGDSEGKRALLRALRQAGGNQSQAARIMGVSRVTIWKNLRKYGIDPHEIRVRGREEGGEE